MKRLYLFLFIGLMLGIGTFSAQAQSLLTGWNNTSGTPYDAGWRVDGSISVTWGALNATSGNRFRTNVGTPASNGTDPMLYITAADTKFGYPVTPTASKMYQLSGKAWRRNGTSGSVTFNFYLTNNLLATNPVSKTTLTISGNNVASSFSGLRLAAPAGFTTGYFLWDVHVNSGSWNDAGLWALQLTELGNAVPVAFETNGGSTIVSQYFLEGESYTISKPVDPTKTGYVFDGWYSDAGFTNAFDFTTPVTVGTTIYAKWRNIKGDLVALITTANGLLSGGTTKGQSYLSAEIATAQAVVDNSSATDAQLAAAFNTLTTVVSNYKDASLSNLQVNGVAIAGFSAITYDYNYDVATNASVPAVSATATATAAATVVVTQASALPGTATVVVTAGDGSTKTYTVNVRVNYMYSWAGNGMGTTTDIPSTFGWACSSAVTWADATSTNDTYAYRYRDNLGVGRVITHPVNNNVFSFPVTLTGGRVYNFTCNISNFNGAVSTMFGINTSSDATGTMLASQTKTAAQWTATTAVDFTFAVATTGTYYLVWQTTNGADRNFAWNFLIKELGNASTITFNTDGGSQVASQYFVAGNPYTVVAPADPIKDGYTFAGWFTSNSYTVPFNFSASVSGSTTVYARFVSQGSPTSTDIVIDNNTLSLPVAKYMNITVNGTSELHISSESAPLVNSTVNLTSDNSWLYFDAVKPSVITSDYLSSVKINGQPFNSQTDRMAIYGGGTVIIPNGMVTGKHALTAYKAENYTGESMQFEVNKYYRTAELGTFDNNIRSFKLKKGYSCTFANNPDGTGFSRVYIASDADIDVPVMPEGLEFASFVRVFRWEWVSKKGWAGGGTPVALTNSTWFNDWAAGGATNNPDFEYTPMRHNLGWDSFTTINARENVSHVLGYNEPDHTDQANCTPVQAIRQWPELFKSGLRLGSPTPDAIRKQWLVDFLATADSLNYRVDFVVGHMYWNGQSGQNLYNGVNDACTRLYGGRPMWITEWNNGANWTTESWPTASGPKRDADMNIIYNADGTTTTVNRPLSPENAAKQLAWIQDALDGLDRCEYLERHSLYNWVQDARAMVLDNKLTPAGKYFAAYKSKVAFSKAKEYIHTWKIAPPLPAYNLSSDYKSIILNWYDHNGETGKSYVLERKLEGETDFTPLATLTAVQDYAYGGNVTYSDPIGSKSAQYRVKAMSYKNTESIYSRTVTLTLDPAVTAPTDLTGTAVSTSIIDLSWSLISGARSYNLKRSTSVDGTYQTVGSFLTTASFRDSGLTPNATYYYKISSLNNRGETVDSDPVAIKTKAIVVPTAITGSFSSAGDAQAALTWDFQYDALYRIYRSDKEDGAYEKVADNIDDTRYADKGLVNGQTYYYKIAAFNTAGEFVNPIVYSVTPQPGQYAYFNFDETTGLVHDLWGGYHGTPSATTSVTGKVNSGLSFVAGSQSYIQLGNGLTSELNDFTLSFWTNYTSKGSRIFDFGNSTSAFMMLTPGMRYKITCPAGTYDVTATGYTLPTGEWTYITLTQEGSIFKMYANGTQIFEDNKATVKPSDMGENLYNYLVKSRWTGNSYSSCILDEFRIYNRALSVDEINALMNGSIYSIKLSSSSLALNVGDTYQLTKTLFPDNAGSEGLVWSSSNEAVATVTNGLVSAKGAGSSTIRVATADGLVDATCTVGVSVATGLTNEESKIMVYLNNQTLFVESPVQETVEVYTVTGLLLLKKDKGVGLGNFVLSSPDRIFVVKGSSGWVTKIAR